MSEKFLRFTRNISRLDRLMRKVKMDGMKDLGLKSSHTMILYLLEFFPQGLTFAQISDLTETDSGLISRTIKELRSADLIQKEGEEGKYKALYFLTESGEKAAAYISEKIEEAEQMVVNGISAEELNAFYQTAQKLADNLEALPSKWRIEKEYER